jgi:uncharacterized membrane protein HdeD (DUF308 family)
MATSREETGGPLKGVGALCKRTWWVFLVGGIASICFGLLALFNPGVALVVLAAFFAAALFVDGLANAFGALTNRDKEGWWLLLLIGLLGIGVAAYAFFHPALTMIAFVYTVAFAAIMLGILCISLGFRIRKESEREWLLYLAGAVSVIFGVLILMQPTSGAVSVVYMIASWAILTGVLRIVAALKLRSLKTHVAERLVGAT